MRKIYFPLIFLAVCLIALTAQQAKAQIAGGYGAADKNDPQVKAAAKYAVAAEAKRVKRGISLISVSKAEVQVVAGLNYKICLKVKDGRRTRRATAVVYKDLRGRRSLTSWDWGDCNW